MNRLTVTEAEQDFGGLVTRICSEGVGVELQRGDRVVAYLTPALPQSPLKIGDLNGFLQNLPKLEDDGEAFMTDIRAIHDEFPTHV